MDTAELYEKVKALFADKSDFITNEDEEDVMDARVPKNGYSALPELPESLNTLNEHNSVSQEEKLEYFQNLHEFRFKMVNGMPLANDEFSYLVCDYCKTSVQEDDSCLTYQFCADCYKDMCIKCFQETNGAKNWHLRKDALATCRESHRIKHRKVSGVRTCDAGITCDDCLPILTEYYADKNDPNYDVCMACYESPDYDKSTRTFKRMDRTSFPIEQAEFGSILDWIPIIKDTGGDGTDLILYNANPESPYRESLCIEIVDDHGRSGYHTLPDNVTLDRFIDELKEYQTKHAEEFDGKHPSWDAYYNRPIKQYAHARNMSVHFG
jgi:hypothetical protein